MIVIVPDTEAPLTGAVMVKVLVDTLEAAVAASGATEFALASSRTRIQSLPKLLSSNRAAMADDGTVAIRGKTRIDNNKGDHEKRFF